MSEPARISRAEETSCPACGKVTDPLRAGNVAILGDRFFYFCDRTCKVDYLETNAVHSMRDIETAEPPSVGPVVLPVDEGIHYFGNTTRAVTNSDFVKREPDSAEILETDVSSDTSSAPHIPQREAEQDLVEPSTTNALSTPI